MSEDEWLDLFRSLGVDKVALSEASALDLHQSAAIPVHAMTVKKAMENYGWEDQLPRRGRGVAAREHRRERLRSSGRRRRRATSGSSNAFDGPL